MNAVKEVELVAANAPAPLAKQDQSTELVLMFERLAKDPAVDVEKLERLIAMQKDILRTQAESAFWRAFSEMQGRLPTITEDGAILVDGQVRSRYSTNEAIQEVIRPILRDFGFSLSFRNTVTDRGVKVTGILAHADGHKECDEFESKPDDGGKMNSIQRIGSTRSYGQRYTTIALLNIVSRAKIDRDDDGAMSEAPPAPDGYDDWQINMEAVADEGWPKLSNAFGRSPLDYRNRATRVDKQWWQRIKGKAEKVQK